MAILDSILFEPDQTIHDVKNDTDVVPDDVFIQSEKEVVLHGWLFRTGNSQAPLVVQMHGNAENITSHACYVCWMTKHGCDVLCWDYRGYGKSNGKPTKSGVVEDAVALLRYAAGIRQGKELIVVGQSMGAAILLNALKRIPDLQPSAVILDGAFESYRGLVRNRGKRMFGSDLISNVVTYLFSDSFNALDAIDVVDSPLVCIHSRSDQIIPFECHWDLFQKARSSRKVFWESQTQKHLDTFRDDSSPYRLALVEWLRELQIL